MACFHSIWYGGIVARSVLVCLGSDEQTLSSGLEGEFRDDDSMRAFNLGKSQR